MLSPKVTTMQTIHSSGGYAVVWRDLDAGGSTARLCMLILQTCIELYNYMVRYNEMMTNNIRVQRRTMIYT